MHVPFQYQVSEYDCVPTTFINAISFLYERRAVPPLVVRHIFAYSLDTVSRGGRLGRSGTSRYAIQLLGQWLNNYKTRKFSVSTEYLVPGRIHLGKRSPIITALNEGGVVLSNIYLGHGEWHFILGIAHDEDWIYFFDPYYRVSLRGLRGEVRIMRDNDERSPNLAVRRSRLDRDDGGARFSFGASEDRECLLMWRTR